MAPETAPDTERRIAQVIAAEIAARPDQVAAAAGLLDGGATVPFVARYRKEATGGLDDGQLRTLASNSGVSLPCSPIEPRIVARRASSSRR